MSPLARVYFSNGMRMGLAPDDAAFCADSDGAIAASDTSSVPMVRREWDERFMRIEKRVGKGRR